MKRFLAFLLAFLLLLSPAVLAHSGKTDANGGHYDRSTGEYHYHHGYPAHQHYDMNGDGIIDCPYDFDDQTGRNSGGSSSGSKKSSSRSTYVPPTPTPTPKKKGITVPPMLVLGICAIPIGATVLIVICAPIYALVDRIVKKRQEKKEKAEYTALYAGKAITDLVDIPRGSSMGADGLPRSGGDGKWGKLYTFYVAKTGKTYHRKYGCSRARTAVNAYDIQTKGRLRPCGICKPELPDMAWVEQYKTVKQNAKKYGIDVEGI